LKNIKIIIKILEYLFIILVLISVLFPIYWMIITSLKPYADIYSIPPLFLPLRVRNNYYRPFVKDVYLKYLINSILISFGNTLVVIPSALLAAYGFSRFKIKGSNDIYFWALTTRMAPPAAFIVPYYLIFTYLGMFDNHLTLVLLYNLFNLPLATWTLKGAIDAIPRDVDEAALIDGCGTLFLIRKVIIPLIKPAIAATSILVFIFSFNEYLFASILTSVNARTITSGLSAFVTVVGTEWGEMAAVGTVCLIPTIIAAILVQKHIVTGLTLGAVKR